MNLANMKKSEILKRSAWKCKHSMTGLTHPACWDSAHGDTERIGFLDIEASNLNADFGIILTYCIKVAGNEKIYQRTVNTKDLRTVLDKNVVKQCITDMAHFDRIVTYYGSRFDIPFIRTRAITLGIPFPEYGSLLHNDAYFMARGRLNMSSKRLENVCRVLFGKTEKTRIDSQHWIKALMGDAAALAYIEDHCQKDVIELERVYNTMLGFTQRRDTSV